MMPTFVTVMECVNAPSAACLTAPSSLALYGLTLLTALFGWWQATQDATRFNHLFGKLLVAALGLLLTSAIAAGAFFMFNGDAPLGVETDPMKQSAWMAVILVFGLGLLLLSCAFGFGLSGTLARLFGMTPRIGRPGVVIAIDGPAASGKGTLARRIADHYRIPCLDTGLLYRAVARDVMARGGKLDHAITAVACANALDPKTFDDPALRGPEAGDAASVVAKIPEVRAALLDYQRNFAKAKFGAVLDGRDIGTVVCPDADVKIYVTATPEERARRRHKELEARGDKVEFETVLEDIHRRDGRDMGRNIAPLWPAKDAITLDTSALNADQAFSEALRIIDFRLNDRT
jgi:CMP/dCMP kinase